MSGSRLGTICAGAAVVIVLGPMIVGTPTESIAHQGAKGVVKERMEIMTAISKNLKIAVQMLRKKIPFDAQAISKVSTSIAEHARQIPKLFPEGSGGKPSEVRPRVWKEWDEFVKMSKNMEKYAEELSAKSRSAKSLADLKPEFKKLITTCRSCHAKFRQKK